MNSEKNGNDDFKTSHVRRRARRQGNTYEEKETYYSSRQRDPNSKRTHTGSHGIMRD